QLPLVEPKHQDREAGSPASRLEVRRDGREECVEEARCSNRPAAFTNQEVHPHRRPPPPNEKSVATVEICSRFGEALSTKNRRPKCTTSAPVCGGSRWP